MLLRLAAGQQLVPAKITETLRDYASKKRQTIDQESRGMKDYIDCYSYMTLMLYLEPLRHFGLGRVIDV